ncbi:hypothetical protein N7532_006117 [Penicillium argentinense]|uniref:Uncharacterized protein n=1 Tax=Penicillium argentinense TaxID=1131581 RepID=A0A9W9FFD4_9EURO|nr:uncharacterized protein N7532_006117 [Penicillium argentinense]KAJ5099116.1 hypothetical protein N7532_006117 [Penicillium argentinense]
MMRPQLRQLAQHADPRRLGRTVTVRAFSVSLVALEGENKTSSQRDYKKSSTTIPRKSPAQSRGPTSGTPNRGRPAKAIDARSFAAPTAGNDQPRVVRSPRLRTVRGGNQPQNRKSKAAASKNRKGRRQQRSRDTKREDVDESLEEAEAAAIQQIEQEQALKDRPTPVRYEPRNIDFSTLQATWPSLPSDSASRSAAVLGKLSSLSGRFANGYIPPHELGRRLWKGQNVLFENDAEKTAAMEEVKRLSQQRADKISQRKGELVEPRAIKFNALGTHDTKTLVETFAQGRYPALDARKDQPAVLGDVARNLRNNGTYQTAGKRPEFMAKVESLLASSRVKRS